MKLLTFIFSSNQPIAAKLTKTQFRTNTLSVYKLSLCFGYVTVPLIFHRQRLDKSSLISPFRFSFPNLSRLEPLQVRTNARCSNIRGALAQTPEPLPFVFFLSFSRNEKRSRETESILRSRIITVLSRATAHLCSEYVHVHTGDAKTPQDSLVARTRLAFIRRAFNLVSP